MKGLHITSFSLVVVGALNLGLMGLFSYNLIDKVFRVDGIVRLVYVVIGVAGVYLLATHKKDCKVCSAIEKTSGPTPPAQTV